MQVWEKNEGAFFIYLRFKKYMFCVQLYGKWVCWGCYNIYFEALKGLLLKNAPYFFFFWFLQKNVRLLSLNMIKLIPLGASTSKIWEVRFPHVITGGWKVQHKCLFFRAVIDMQNVDMLLTWEKHADVNIKNISRYITTCYYSNQMVLWNAWETIK